MKLVQPDYKNSLVNLSNSILKHYGLSTGHPTLKTVDQALEKGYKNVVLLILDGLGSSLLRQHLKADSFLNQHHVEDITSVFPATTVAATTSILTGLTPAEHGWLGWDMYFESVNRVVTTFFNTVKHANERAAIHHLAKTELPITTLIDRINASGNAKGYWLSPFEEDVLASAVADDSKALINLMNYDIKNLDTLFEKIETLCAEDEQKLIQDKRFIYAYSAEPDYLMHHVGTKNQKVTELITYLDEKVANLSEKLEDTMLIIVADHGHITAGEYFYLDEYPEIQDMLQRETAIEPRCAAFFIKEGMHADFERLFKQHFGKWFNLYTKQEVKDEQFFGTGKPHEKFNTFLGDYLAVAISDKSISDYHPSALMKGIHAGLLEGETVVPLIMVGNLKGSLK